nr:hypothetical protein [Streptomyces agglomeratus]
MNDIADRILVSRYQLGDDRYPEPTGRCKQHHRPPVAHHTGAAPPRDLLQPLPFLISQSTHSDRLSHRTSTPLDRLPPPSNRPDRQREPDPGEPTRPKH